MMIMMMVVVVVLQLLGILEHVCTLIRDDDDGDDGDGPVIRQFETCSG